MEEEHTGERICRVCRSEGSPEKPLYHPCVCTGSIKYVHQECLVQWLRYSKKEYCELCKHKFAFKPIYAENMPGRLPAADILSGLAKSVLRAVKYWLHYTLVAIAWLGIVPLTACRIYRCLFSGSLTALLTLPLDIMSTNNIISDIFNGCFVVMCTLCAFISLVWLREQILNGAGPEWLEHDFLQGANFMNLNNNRQQEQPQANAGQQDAGNPNNVNNQQPPQIQQQPRQQQENAEEGWNPIDWDRAADELTWERLLGLDGSLVFIEHVFWVVSLNTLFIVLFAILPYHFGQIATELLGLKPLSLLAQFEGVLTTVLGYVVTATIFVIVHTISTILGLQKLKRIVGVSYIVVKVSLLVVVEIGIFPLVCGWWLDICSLPLFNASLSDRKMSVRTAPGTAMFIHWLVGMLYVFYLASFILLLREMLRPGVLWFLRNLNDPDFNPIHEMMQLPVFRHVRRFLASLVIFGTTVLVMLHLPTLFIKKFLPSFLPYHVTVSADAPLSELSLELLLLQVVLPALLEHGYMRQWLKTSIKSWCIGVANILDLRSYLLGDIPLEDDGDGTEEGNVEEAAEEVEEDEAGEDVDEDDEDDEVEERNEGQAPAAGEGLGAEHQALLHMAGPTGFQPYRRPTFFAVRLILLVLILATTLFVVSSVSLVVPVAVGRFILDRVLSGTTKIHELYTAACGAYACWLVTRTLTVLYKWIPKGWKAILKEVFNWLIFGFRLSIIGFLFIVVIPFMLGVLFETVIAIPLRVPLDQSPILFLWQDWALGVLHTKIICAVTMLGPNNWWLKRNLERAYNDGLRRLSLKFYFFELFMPSATILGLALSIPYVVGHSVAPGLFGIDHPTTILVERRIYPLSLAVLLFCRAAVMQVKQFKKLYEHIKNDKYLVGQRLVNYERRID